MAVPAQNSQLPKSSGDRQAYRPYVDGLRAVAILAVVAYHAGIPGISGGFVGVDIFFVISGYLITGLLVQELITTGSIRLGAFIARRIRRLLPALLTVVMATLGISMVAMYPQELPRLAKSAIALMFVSSNFHFMRYSGGYFDPSTDLMPLLHTWSLSVEEQYYLTWPLLMLLVGWLARNIGRWRVETLVFFTLIAILASSYAASYWFSHYDLAAAFYLMPLRAWELALGGAVHLAGSRWPMSFRTGSWMAWIGFIALVISLFLIDETTLFPGTAVLLPTSGTALLLFGLNRAGESAGPARWLSKKPFLRIGLLSYSWYLWHWPLLALTRSYYLGERDLWRDSAVVVVALIAAALSYRLIECPVRYQKPWLFSRTRTTILLGVALSIIVALCAEMVRNWGNEANRKFNEQMLAPSANPFGKGRCKESKDGRTLAPQAECQLGSAESTLRTIAWGDSHTGHLIEMLSANALATGERVLVRTHGACPPVLGAIPYKTGEAQFACGHFNENVIAEIRNLTHGTVRGAILSARWNAQLGLPNSDPGAIVSYALRADWHSLESGGDDKLKVGIPPLDSVTATQVLASSLRQSLTELQRIGVRVLLVAPTPELHFNTPQCLYRRSEKECRLPRERVDERRAATLNAFNVAIEGLNNVKVWDPIDQFCDDRWCYGARDGRILFADSNHLSGEMSRHLLAEAQPYLRWLTEP
jgi:peptidoglycan/LPS O-acetylase OafA/YrhL